MAALRAYFGLMADWQAASLDPNDQGVELPHHAVGQALALISRNVTAARQSGTVAKGAVNLLPSVTALDLASTPAEAKIEDCADTTNYLSYKASDGSLVTNGGTPGGKHRVLARAHLVGGAWFVYEMHIYTVGSC